MPDLYLPSNGHEGMGFEAGFCDRCERDRAFWQDGNLDPDLICEIHSNALAGKHVKEWQYIDGEPVCTAFELADDETDCVIHGKCGGTGGECPRC